MIATGVELTRYDWIIINSSAGKDSQAMLDFVVEQAKLQGVELSHLVVVHCDLGRVEWKGTKELAEAQANHYGLRFEVVARPQGDLLDHVEQRGMWPSAKARFCTSDHKRGQAAKVITALVSATRLNRGNGRPVQVLNCMGFRADESTARAKRQSFSRDVRLTNSKRIVDTWLPIHDWTAQRAIEPSFEVRDVWARIKASGVPYHFAYDKGMPRLSCCFCIFAPKAALMVAGRENPKLLDQYVAVEKKINHTFRVDLTLASVRDALRNGEPVLQGPIENWCM